MKNFASRVVFAVVVLLYAVGAIGQTMTVSGSHVQDAAGNACANCRITFAPVDLNGRPISFRIGGGGQVQSNPVSATVTNGAYSIVLPDVSQTNPQNVCFKTTAVDKSSGVTVLGPLGYTCVQPSSTIGGWCGATTCNFDNYVPNTPGLPLLVHLILTTNGDGGPATYDGTTLNIPVYTGGSESGVSSFNTRTGAVTPATGDYSVGQVTGAAPLASPALTGTPTAPTAAPGANTTQLATTAFTHAAIAAITFPVTSFNTRTGAVVPASGDYSVGQVTGAAPLASPTFTGIPAAPTATAGTNTTQLATTAFTQAAIAAITYPVTSFNSRTGAVVPASGDYTVSQVTGAAPAASPTFTGTPAAPTATLGTNTTQLATTAFTQAAIAAITYPVTSFNSRTGAVVPASGDYSVGQVTGAAPLASPTFTGTPAAPTATPGTNTTQLATTAFTQAAIAALTFAGYTGSFTIGDCIDVQQASPLVLQDTGSPCGTGSSGVASFNTRTGAVVPASGDYSVGQVTGAAPLASPALTGTPTAPTATAGTNTTQLATTAFTQAAITAITFPVTSFNSRSGAVVPASGDYTVSQVTGAAPTASPTFTGTPAAPTATLGTNTTQLATTAFTQAAIAAITYPVTSFNSRTGAVVPASGDYTVSQVTGAAPTASPTFTGTPAAPTATVGTNTTQLATTAFTQAAIAAITYPVTSFNTRTGAVVPASGDYSVGQVTGAAPLASPTFTGTPAAPTASAGTNTTQLATTAFTQAAIAAGPTAGTVTYTASTSASAADNGKLVIMNCTSACAYTLPTTQPLTTWAAAIISIGSTTATIALGGSDTFNGSASVPVLNKFAVMRVHANSASGTDYKGDAPLVATAPFTLTPSSNGLAGGCATCVTASSPGAGVAHFAGSTQAVTSSLIVAADITALTVTGAKMANNTVTATQLAAQYSKGSCTEVWGGSGTSFALTSGDDAISNNSCYNDSGVTRTITAVKCRSDVASNTTTVNPTFGSAGTGTTVLSGALTCGSSLAYSSTGTVSNASWTTGSGINPVMGGTLTGKSIAVIVEYTY